MSRREFLKSSSIAVSSLVGASSVIPEAAYASSIPAASTYADKANAISEKLFADDGLAIPIATKPTVSPLAKGLDRTLVLGGGGEYYIAWYCGFFHGLLEAGLDMAQLPGMVVGTSAGSYMGSSLLSGHFTRLRNEMDFFGEFPKIFAKLAPVTSPNISQKRAMEINMAATDGSIETRQILGRAALAANNHLNGPRVEALAALLTGDSKTDWPTPRMYTTGIDCYTGERLVVSQASAKRNNIALAHAVAASSSLPGIVGPTLIGQRYCMDGGMCSNPAHVDLVAGSKRALVISLTDGVTGPILTKIPHPMAQNIADVRATGTKVKWIVAGAPSGISLTDPREIAPAIKAGYERAKKEADEIKSFWM
ncbi:patatin-like phospholipase family protein [Orrella daihaiensis]|uniref:Patatin-like phospholipase family protein n=1 Tax=Orrella daihaiensis TaxID=2782176 RepID=A0ABY4AIZ8_9BURK|nr:patatin-like phospholipase family protein [Orrella daihaiensis]UOD50266.1 patatin-like phospholipase family protein [Orrella daihaiensis]